MTGDLRLLNKQRTRPIDLRLLRRIILELLTECARPRAQQRESGNKRSRNSTRRKNRIWLRPGRDALQGGDFDLAIHLLGARAMSVLNQKLLKHQGPTDVITLDFSDPGSPSLVGEVYVCVDEALAQAKRFRTEWQAELVRYIVHAGLHLEGYDDRLPRPRSVMKREEGRRLRDLSRRFDLSKLARKPSSLSDLEK